MTFYSESADLSLELLTEFGQTITRRVVTAGVYDPTTQTVINTNADTSRKGAIFDFGRGETTSRGNLIQGTDKRLLMDATGLAAMTDIYIIDSITYTVVSVGEINPAGTSVLFDMHVRA